MERERAGSLKLDATFFGRTAAIVRDRRAVFQRFDVQAGSLNGRYRTFSSRARTFDANVYVLDAKLHRLFRSLLSGTLSGKRRAFSTALEAARPCAGPAKRIALGVGYRYGRVVKRRANVRDRYRYVATCSTLLGTR